jgi:uncharacterized protein DUF5684
MLSVLTTFAQDYTYYTVPDTPTDAGGLGGLMVAYAVFGLIFAIPAIVGLWKIFEKAGKPGWAAIIPIYNLYIYLQVVGRPVWWMLFFLLAFIPFVGAVVGIVLGFILANDLAKSFNKDMGYTVLLFLLPFIGYPLLGFGSAEYKGPSALGMPATAVAKEKPDHAAPKHKA